MNIHRSSAILLDIEKPALASPWIPVHSSCAFCVQRCASAWCQYRIHTCIHTQQYKPRPFNQSGYRMRQYMHYSLGWLDLLTAVKLTVEMQLFPWNKLIYGCGQTYRGATSSIINIFTNTLSDVGSWSMSLLIFDTDRPLLSRSHHLFNTGNTVSISR